VRLLGSALLAVSATSISCAGRSEVVCATPIPISADSMAAVQAHAAAILQARGYALYSAEEQMRRIERYDVPLRAYYESLVYADRDVSGVCGSASNGCRGVGVVIVYIVRDEGAGTASWHALVRAYTSRRPGALDRFSLVQVSREVQADADAVIRELKLTRPGVIS
jgi:hypothetical protein